MRTTLVLSMLPAALAWAAADAQSLGSRVARLGDGVVRMEVPSRPGTCGDGRETIGYRNALFARNFQSVGGRWSNSRCVPGPLLVTLTVENGQVTQMRTQVGGRWPSDETGVADFGAVPPLEASAYFFSLVPRLESASRKDRLLIAAVLADEAPVIQPLLALARDDDRATHTRQHAIQWLGLLGDATVLPTLIEFARADSDDDGDKGLSGAALAALGSMEGDAGIRAGQWLIARALDGRERVQLRKNALFWAGQREDTPTADLVRAYREAEPANLREHAIFVLSQRKDNAATEALMNIAREDKDTKMRGKALFWLAQNDDPRVRKLIADLILK